MLAVENTKANAVIDRELAVDYGVRLGVFDGKH